MPYFSVLFIELRVVATYQYQINSRHVHMYTAYQRLHVHSLSAPIPSVRCHSQRRASSSLAAVVMRMMMIIIIVMRMMMIIIIVMMIVMINVNSNRLVVTRQP